ncbi:hypothetical protein ICN42_10845 [Polynucleobacter sp. 71A-WALBACH]|uniref:hypothetical protein n=1 Tax=Polynucleobacter sp. 71A-WALBACH TaxID=2689097 RepID=UPI0002B83F96|nr:hypothetical protein [Polynucleobacter sp. 71A-WALBACH]AGG33855.1 hypothetical protein D521_1287 [beta proteobacterium CB]MBU3594586.1 hypothetical protein [Polynucleobacter sp. 71A-WALBACH]
MKKIIGCLTLLALLVGCAQPIPPEALQFSPDTLANRQLQSRKYDIKSEKELLSASNNVLQDMGFNLDESNMPLGVIVASKNRDATDGGQIAGAILMAALFGVQTNYDKEQKIRASLVTKPASTNNPIKVDVTTKSGKQVKFDQPVEATTSGFVVRVTFQRLVWNQKGVLSKIEGINDQEIYREFFDKLSKSIFLQAQNVE